MEEDKPDKPDKPNSLHAGKDGGPLTPKQRADKQEKFLKAYRETGNIKHSCKRAGINRSTYYEWHVSDEPFKAQLSDAELEANDTLEIAAYERAVHGVPSYVVSQGKLVYGPDGKPLIERKYSDALLTTSLKARMPEKYKERTANEHTGKDGGPIKVERHMDLQRLTDEELANVERILLEAKERGE